MLLKRIENSVFITQSFAYFFGDFPAGFFAGRGLMNNFTDRLNSEVKHIFVNLKRY